MAPSQPNPPEAANSSKSLVDALSSVALGRQLWVVVIVVNAALLLLAALSLADSRTRQLESALHATEQLTHLIAQDVDNEYEKIDLVLRTVAGNFGEQRRSGAANLENWLQSQHRLNPQLNVLRVADASGQVIYAPDAARRLRANLSDRAYFQRLRDDPAAGVQVFGPVVGRTTGQTVMILARRLVNDHGEFQGVVLGSIRLDFFYQRFARLLSAEGATIAVRDGDLKLLMHYPESPGVAAGASDDPPPPYLDAWRRHPGTGSYRGASGTDGIERLGSYRQSETFGFYVNMGIPVDSVLTTWYRHLKLMSAFWLLFVALSILLARQLQLAWREQHRAVVLHRESEQRLRLVAENTAEYICGVNPDRSISFVNRPVPGLDPDQVAGGDIFSLFPAAVRLVASSVLEGCFLLQESGEFEYEAAGSRGEPRSYWAQATPVVIGGEVATVVITMTDITERKRFEQQVLNSRELLRQFLDHFPGVAYAKDESLQVVMASRGFKALLGLEPREMIGRRNGELFPRQMAEKMDADERQVLVDGKTRVIEEELAGRVYESTKFRIAQHESWLLAGITVDVTQRQRAAARVEMLLRLSALGGTVGEREFIDAGLRMAETLTGSKIGFLHFVNDDQETIQLASWTAGALKNCEAIDDARYPISQAGIWADCFRRREAVMFNDYPACADERGLPEGHAALQRLVSVPVIEDGQVRMMLGVGNKLDDYDDFDLQSVRLIGNDLWRVVRRVRVEQALTQHLAELTELNRKLAQAQNQLLQSEKMATIGQLAAGVAHELNNPIGFVQSNLGTLSAYVDDLLEIVDCGAKSVEKHGDAATAKAYRELAAKKDLAFLREDVGQLLAESKDGADRVRRIVQNLKDFSHVSDDEWTWADLHKGLDSTLNIVWNEIKYKAEVEKRYTALPEVFCVPSQLNQVFMNLLVNAAQAIEGKGKIIIASGLVAGEEAPPAAAAVADQGQAVWIEISDTGKGIPAENLVRVFDPFFTTKPVGQGTGLGLSLAWSIIQKHHGSLTVDSTVGVGTTFRITLPIEGKATPGVPSNE